MAELRFFEIKGDKASDRVAVYEDELLGEWVSREQAEQLQQHNTELTAQVELLRDNASEVIDDYFDYLESYGIDSEDLGTIQKRKYDLMAALKTAVYYTPAQCLAEIKAQAIQEEYSSLLHVVANQYDGNDTTDWSIGANHVFVLFAKEIQKRLDKLRNQKGGE